MTWKEKLADQMPAGLAREIEVFETQMDLRKQDKLALKIFAETRLRRGVYGQRYDNGQRHDGERTQALNYPCGPIEKGPDTIWDAPGMQRIKIPFGGLNPGQMDLMADLAEEYSDGILHVTTRQDIQLHYVHIEDTPDLMRRLASVGITTREACGNSVRNVTACPISGVCRDETFDVTPYANALTRFLLGHPDVQDFGRKFKPSFSGCAQHACGLVSMHDIGFVAKVQQVEGAEKRGFQVWVGGGLGAVPHQAKVMEEFVPEEELLPLTQAVCRVFARLGEKENRAKARIKFLVAKLGMDEFRRLVLEERQTLPHDDRWTAYLETIDSSEEKPLKDAVQLAEREGPEGFDEWRRTNAYAQKQPGYAAVTVTLILGDLTSLQMRKLAELARRYCGESVRTTVEQNLLLRWVVEADLPKIYEELKAIGLGQPGAESIVDVTACPGTDTCKLGIASSRGLAAVLRKDLFARRQELDPSIRGLRIKISGCFNSCGQHHVADIGFYGASRSVGTFKVPHFLVILGGKWLENAGAYGLAIVSVPSKAIPKVVDRITGSYVAEKENGESFQDWIHRVGKKDLRDRLADLTEIPDIEEQPEFYQDWGDPRTFTLGDMGIGECAGEIVELVQVELAGAERDVFEAQLLLDDGHLEKADALAYRSMLNAAKALIKVQFLDVADEPDTIVSEFKTRFYDTELFYNPYAKGKFARYLFNRHENPLEHFTVDTVRQQIEEAQLFIEAAYACRDRMPAPAAAGTDDLFSGGIPGGNLPFGKTLK